MILEKLKGHQAVWAYPDGWTCVSCGDEYTEKTIDVEDFYVLHTEHGTECLKCVDETKKKKEITGYYGYYDKKKRKRVFKTLWKKI